MSTILVIDDDPMIAKLVLHKLSRLGHDVHIAPDGQAGIGEAHRLKPDLVLVDWMMPGMTGVEFCRELRASPVGDVPLILLSAKAQTADLEEGLKAGATAYITKPFSPRELAKQVTELLAQAAR